jgi:diacylglycerol kinase family enzyme
MANARSRRARPVDKRRDIGSNERIDVIVNTTARLHRTRPDLLARMEQRARGVAVVHPTTSLAELDAAVRAIAQRGTSRVVLSGGDGTFMAGVTALARAFGEDHLPEVSFLPAGTVATVARNWGAASARGDLAERLARLLAHRGAALSRPTLRVRAERGEDREERVGFIFGTGLVAGFFDRYYAEGARGLGGAAKIVARIFAESFWGGAYARRVLDPMPCSIEVEGRALDPKAFSLVCAAVVKDLGLHMEVTYRAGEDPQRPHLVASPLSARQLGPRAPLVLAGKRIGGAGHFDDLVGDFAVRFPAGVTGRYVLDGDMLRAEVVRVSAGPLLRVVG